MKKPNFKEWWNALSPKEQNDLTVIVIGEKVSYKKLNEEQIKKIFNWSFK